MASAKAYNKFIKKHGMGLFQLDDQQIAKRAFDAGYASAPSAETPSGWTPAIHGESLPDKIGHYLCLCDDGAQMVCFLNVMGTWSVFPGAQYYGDLAGAGQSQPDRTVTHWMPLPTPPAHDAR